METGGTCRHGWDAGARGQRCPACAATTPARGSRPTLAISRQALLEYLYERQRREGRLPTVGALAQELGRSLAVVQRQVGDLRAQGYLWAARRRAQPLRLTAKGADTAGALAQLRDVLARAPEAARRAFAGWLVEDGLLDAATAEDALERYAGHCAAGGDRT